MRIIFYFSFFTFISVFNTIVGAFKNNSGICIFRASDLNDCRLLVNDCISLTNFAKTNYFKITVIAVVLFCIFQVTYYFLSLFLGESSEKTKWARFIYCVFFTNECLLNYLKKNSFLIVLILVSLNKKILKFFLRFIII